MQGKIFGRKNMRIMIDTNVIISAILFPKSLPDRAVEKVLMEHHLILCSHIIDELHIVLRKSLIISYCNLKSFYLNFLLN